MKFNTKEMNVVLTKVLTELFKLFLEHVYCSTTLYCCFTSVSDTIYLCFDEKRIANCKERIGRIYEPKYSQTDGTTENYNTYSKIVLCVQCILKLKLVTLL